MKSLAYDFKARATRALGDEDLQTAMRRAHGGFVYKRQAAIDAFPEFEALRVAAREMKTHTLAYLDYYLERYESGVLGSGGQVHWASTAEEACAIVAGICAKAGAKRVLKGKTMVGEEIGANEALEAAGMEVIETDLGEYIIQLAKEPPSHIIAPAVHKTRAEISELFHAHHQQHGLTGRVTEVGEIVDEARKVLRAAFLSGDVGITGANLLVAETGSSVLVTNEGNGDLSATLPKVHVVIASIDKVVPTLEDATAVLRLLGRSATGQVLTSYTSFFTGPRRGSDRDGPEAYHVVLVDNGRSQILGGEYREILRCIRCGACLNHCPVYGSIGGHAYGWVYPGPMGSVLTPLMVGLRGSADLPNACTLNGRCAEVCPVGIPLPTLLRGLRSQAFAEKVPSVATRLGLAVWAFLATRPRLYRLATALGSGALRILGRRHGRVRRMPFAGGWTGSRDLPAPQGTTFQSQWRQHVEGRGP